MLQLIIIINFTDTIKKKSIPRLKAAGYFWRRERTVAKELEPQMTNYIETNTF